MLDLLRQNVDSYLLTKLLTASKEERWRICYVPDWTFDPPMVYQQLFNPTFSFLSFIIFATIGLVSITFTVRIDPFKSEANVLSWHIY